MARLNYRRNTYTGGSGVLFHTETGVNAATFVAKQQARLGTVVRKLKPCCALTDVGRCKQSILPDGDLFCEKHKEILQKGGTFVDYTGYVWNRENYAEVGAAHAVIAEVMSAVEATKGPQVAQTAPVPAPTEAPAPASVASAEVPKYIDWSQQPFHELGDYPLALKLGVTVSSVRRARAVHGKNQPNVARQNGLKEITMPTPHMPPTPLHTPSKAVLQAEGPLQAPQVETVTLASTPLVASDMVREASTLTQIISLVEGLAPESVARICRYISDVTGAPFEVRMVRDEMHEVETFPHFEVERDAQAREESAAQNRTRVKTKTRKTRRTKTRKAVVQKTAPRQSASKRTTAKPVPAGTPPKSILDTVHALQTSLSGQLHIGEVAKRLGITYVAAQSRLKEAMKLGTIERLGEGFYAAKSRMRNDSAK